MGSRCGRRSNPSSRPTPRATTGPATAGYLRTNWALHRRISALCTNDFARSLYDGLLGFAESEVEDVAGRGAFDGAANLEVHRAYVEAIGSGDPELAAEAALRHNAAASYVT